MKNKKIISIFSLAILYVLPNLAMIRAAVPQGFEGVPQVHVENKSEDTIWIDFMDKGEWFHSRVELAKGASGLTEDRFQKKVAAPGSQFHFGTKAGRLPKSEIVKYDQPIKLAIKKEDGSFDNYILTMTVDGSGKNVRAEIKNVNNKK